MDYSKFERSTLIDILAEMFKCLHVLSPAKFIKKIVGRWFSKTKNYRVIDVYVTSWPILLILLLVCCNFFSGFFLTIRWLILLLISLRLIEMICVTFDVLVFDRYRAQKRGEEYFIASPERTFILGIFNYFEILFSFSIVYFLFGMGKFNGEMSFDNVFDSLYFSALTLTTLGYGDIKPIGTSVRLISVIEAITGVFVVAIIIARGISLLKPPKSLSETITDTTDKSEN